MKPLDTLENFYRKRNILKIMLYNNSELGFPLSAAASYGQYQESSLQYFKLYSKGIYLNHRINLRFI